MIYEFLPWKLDVDAEATKLFYETNDFSKDKSVNEEFIESLTEEQKNFFNSLGVNLFKIEVDKTIYDIPEDEDTPASKIKRIVINFLIKGKILALPQYQKEIYSDEEVFGKDFPASISVLSYNDDDYLKTFDNGIGLGIVFKHPCFHYDDEKFKKWDCGYILESILIMKDI